jgi:hypothetical protein
VGNIFQFSLPFCGGMTNWNLNGIGQNPFLQVMLVYLANLWQLTVGANNASDSQVGTPPAGNFVVNVSGYELLNVVLHWSAIVQDGYHIKGVPNSGNYGVYAWSRGGFLGPMHRLSWQQQIVFPDIPSPDSLYVFTRSPLTCTWIASLRTAGGDPIYINSQPSNLATGTLNNLGSQPTTEGTTEFDSAQANFLNVAAVIGGFISTILFQAPVQYVNSSMGYNTGTIYAMVCAYISELWQYLVVPHIGTAAGGSPISQYFTQYLSTLGFLKQATLAITPPSPARTTYNYGYPGVQHYGWWAPIYGANIGDLQYLNFAKCNLRIPGQGCNGAYIFLEQGCTGSLVTQEDSSQVYGSDTPYGHVNLVTGVTSGLDYTV